MTARDWRADRSAVFDRDAYTCRHCDAVGGDDGPATLRTAPVGDVPLEGEVHESALVTVCDDCFAPLESEPSTDAVETEALFRLVRETTGFQGATISDVAAFASLATSLPAALESALDEETDVGIDESVLEYRRARLDVLLALAIVDARLERLAALRSTVDPEVRASLEAFAETATALQSTLRKVVALGETVATGLGRCQGCFDEVRASADATCATCGLAVRETSDWQGEDGTLAFDRLFATTNETLQGATETTEALTDRTMALAEQLTASQ
ncbi:HNH endonuclease [Natrinema zhouii]|uniref:HNH endonuclease n=1 Tax=Natrinema zhouii TaxID=1710539 RepID=A0A7D6CPF6_9EURY|nr:HNH endonuclease [Natrinema zhouii]QLK24953.1 HNH endonuclease [Natrinema zhouii]